ncbi:MAG: DNA mismatch repair endonuclease MutL [Myxococcota bacterium]
MAGRIRVLDGALVDQIAAGEVVERPASVVKELLENALDAGASRVTIEVEGGGVERIGVSDDGEGMAAEDAPRALIRHATSKIGSVDDLQAVRTLGFRGEALPSIASVSRLVLTTRTRDAVEGRRVRIDGGSEPTVEAIGCAPGTTVEVYGLFGNVPARRKFLKSRATENAHITDVCQRVALARPELHLVLLREGRRVREHLPTPDLLERTRSVLQEASLGDLEAERDGVRLRALLGPPEKARAGAGGLHVFVNGRPVKDRALSRAIAFAYGSVMPPGRFPTGVVHVHVDPEQVDVNVHPRKAEVRFTRGRDVLDLITRMLAAKLGTAAWSGPAARGAGYWEQRLGMGRSAPTPSSESAEPTGEAYAPGDPATTSSASEPPGADPWGLSPVLHDREAPSPATSEPLLPEASFFGSLRVLGQVRKMLIVCEGEEALHIIDQHAADERVRYDRLRTQHRAREVAMQRLLFPERVECSEADVAFLEEHGEALAALGLECAIVGPSTVAVHAVPTVVRRATPERLLRDVIDELTRRGDRAFGDAVDMALATMACHGSIRAGDPLSPEECRALLEAMDRVQDFGGHCPHGRPVVHSVSFGDLERRLGR